MKQLTLIGSQVLVRSHSGVLFDGVIKSIEETTSGIRLKVLSGDLLFQRVRPDQIVEVSMPIKKEVGKKARSRVRLSKN